MWVCLIQVLDMDIDHVLSIFSTVIGVATKEVC